MKSVFLRMNIMGKEYLKNLYDGGSDDKIRQYMFEYD